MSLVGVGICCKENEIDWFSNFDQKVSLSTFFEFFLFRNRHAWIPPSPKWTHQLGIGTCWV
jgi:hypothetical protein